MSKMPSSISSLLLIVAFLVLTAIATTLYSSNAEQKTKLEGNVFWQKASIVVGDAWYLLQAFADMGLKKYDTNSTANSGSSQDSESGAGSAAPTNFLSDLGTKIKDEWNNSGAVSPETTSGLKLDDNFNGIFKWQPTENGAEIIFRPKGEKEYILPLPFSFLKAN